MTCGQPTRLDQPRRLAVARSPPRLPQTWAPRCSDSTSYGGKARRAPQPLGRPVFLRCGVCGLLSVVSCSRPVAHSLLSLAID